MTKTALIDTYPAKAIRIETKEYPISRITEKQRVVRISQKLPFYVRFENVSIEGYGPSSPAPIGIAVIGINNYIL